MEDNTSTADDNPEDVNASVQWAYSQRKLLMSAAGVVAILLAVAAYAVVQYNSPKDGSVMISSLFWQRSIPIERYEVELAASWNPPPDATIVSIEQRGVPRNSDSPEGMRFDLWYTYEVVDWKIVRTITVTGNRGEDKPTWEQERLHNDPRPGDQVGEERPVDVQLQAYYVKFRDATGATHKREIDQHTWNQLQIDQLVPARYSSSNELLTVRWP